MIIEFLVDVKDHHPYKAGSQHTVKAKGPRGFLLDDGTLVALSKVKVVDTNPYRVTIRCKDIGRGRDYLWSEYIVSQTSNMTLDLADLDKQGWEVVAITRRDIWTDLTIRKPIERPPLGNPVAEYDKLDNDSLDAIVEVVGEGRDFREYNKGKSMMRKWFLSRLRTLWDLPHPVEDLDTED